MKYNELQSLSDEELVHKELGLERELITARFQLYTNQLDDSSRLKKIRRDIARLQTAARQRELDQGLNKNSLRDRYRSTFLAAGADAGESAEAPAAEGGEAAAEGGEAAAEGGEAAAEGGEAAAEGGDAEEVICCEFGGAKGTATRAKCEEYKGTIHPRSDCP